MKICALEGCTVEFKPKATNQLFCSKSHGRRDHYLKHGNNYKPKRYSRKCRCGKLFECTDKRQTYHSKACITKHWKLDNPEKYKKIRQRTHSLQKAGRLIKAEITDTPIPYQKFIWDGHGKWAKFFDWCQGCGKNLYIHHAGGLCERCYRTFQSKDNYQKNKTDRIEYARVQRENSKADKKNTAAKSEYRKIALKTIKGAIQRTDKIQNILINTKLEEADE